MGLFDSIRRTLGGGDDSSTAESSAGESSTDDGPAVTDSTSLSPTDFRQRAEDVADRAEQLDFSVESLVRLDRAVAEQYDGETVTDGESDTAYTTNTVRFGSYLGEVLVRDLDGRWVRDDGWGVTVAGRDGELTVAVFDVAARSFADEPVFAAVVDRLEAELALDTDAADAADGSDPQDEQSPDGTADATDDTNATTDQTAETTDDTGESDDGGWGEVADDWQPATEKAGSDTAGETGLSDLGSVADTPDTADTTAADDADDDDGFVIPDAEGGVAAGGDSADAAGSEQSGGASVDASADDSQTESDGTETGTGDTETAPETGMVSESPETGAADEPPEPETDGTLETADDGETDGPDAWSLAADDGTESAWPPDTEAEQEPTASPDDDPTVGDGLRAEQAQTATEFAAFWGEHDLDFTPASLERLDALVDTEWDEERFADATFGETERFEDQSFTNLVGELGSYFGEVLVRDLDGEWTEDTDHEAAVVVTGADGRLAVPVYQVAITSLRGAAAFDRSYRALLADLSAGEE